MAAEFVKYRDFFESETAAEFVLVLREHGIDYEVEEFNDSIGAPYGERPLSFVTTVRIKKEDFPKVDKVLAEEAKALVDQVDKDHYLYKFSNEELFEVISKPDEWSAVDYQLAKTVLRQRGVMVDDTTFENLTKRRLEQVPRKETTSGYRTKFSYILWLLITGIVIISLLVSTVLLAQENPAALVVESIAATEPLNGVVLVAQDGKVLYENAFGKADFDKGTPMTKDTKFIIGSITKQFTAAIVMQEVEKKKINLDKTIIDYLPGFRNETGSKITIRHLLTHTHGIPNVDFVERTKPITRDDFIKKYCEINVAFEPGTRFEYSNIVGYYLLGMILEKVTGKTYEKLLEERITRPLKMNHTGYLKSRDDVKNLAFGHHAEQGQQASKLPDWHTSYSFSAAGVYSTTGDLLIWDRALRGTSVLTNESLNAMFTQFSYQVHYGFGWHINDPDINGVTHIFAGHTGGANGFMSQVMRGVGDDVIVIYLSNTDRYSELRYPVLEVLVK